MSFGAALTQFDPTRLAGQFQAQEQDFARRLAQAREVGPSNNLI